MALIASMSITHFMTDDDQCETYGHDLATGGMSRR